MNFKDDEFINIYGRYFKDNVFSTAFANAEFKKGYQRIHKINYEKNLQDFEMREYFPFNTSKSNKYHIFSQNMKIHKFQYEIPEDFANSSRAQNFVLISTEGLNFFENLYNCKIFYSPIISQHILYLFSLYMKSKTIKFSIHAHISYANCQVFYHLYMLYLKIISSDKNISLLNTDNLINLIIKFKDKNIDYQRKQGKKIIYDEICNIINICKKNIYLCKEILTVAEKAKSKLIIKNPTLAKFKEINNEIIKILDKLNLQKHYFEIRNMTKEFLKKENTTRFFLNFDLNDFLLFYIYYLKKSSGSKIMDFINIMKSKLQIIFTYERLLLNPICIFSLYFEHYCNIFEDALEIKRSMNFFINGKKTIKKAKHLNIKLRLIKPQNAVSSSNKKVYPFSPVFTRIKESVTKTNLYPSRRKLEIN